MRKWYGAPGRISTLDHRFRTPPLYSLSYRGMVVVMVGFEPTIAALWARGLTCLATSRKFLLVRCPSLELGCLSAAGLKPAASANSASIAHKGSCAGE